MKIERKSMKKYMLDYIEYVDNNKVDLNEHLIKINFFQHERLIHLLVTLATLILYILTFIIGIINNNIFVIIIGYLIMCFLIPYIYHYFLLENGVQKMYRQYDKMIKK